MSTRSGKIIPIPSLAKQTYDYKTPNTYKGLFMLGKFRMRKSIKKILQPLFNNIVLKIISTWILVNYLKI